MKFNGIMLDCSRLIERHEYYFDILDFMADWKMNTLLLHFSDDFGCSIKLPGFEELALPNSFSAEEIKALVKKSQKLGIDIIPEIETFGHTRYITDHSHYEHLRVVEKSESLELNALNPFLDESIETATRLIQEVAGFFASEYIHIGCDEVNLGDLPEKHGVSPEKAWTDYVNKVISAVYDSKKIPMIWADHLAKSDFILNNIEKDIVLLEWRYEKKGEIGTDSLDISRYKKNGFKNIILAPAIAMFYHRWLPNRAALKNVETCIEIAEENDLPGIISTIWVPFRYQRDAMHYGMAFSGFFAENRGKTSNDKFNEIFAIKVFGVQSSPPLKEFLSIWPDLIINNFISSKLIQEDACFSDAEINLLEKNYENGIRLLSLAKDFSPPDNIEIWNSMLIVVKAALLCSSCYYGIYSKDSEKRMNRQKLIDLIEEFIWDLDAEWDRTRYAEDYQKSTPKFTGWDEQYNLIFFKRLKKKLRP